MITYNNKEIPEHLQKYFEPAELGLEKTPEEYVKKLVDVFHEVKRVLRDDGTLWLNLGDSYNSQPPGNTRPLSEASGLPNKTENLEMRRNGYVRPKKIEGIKPKDLIGIPWLVAFALRADGWYLRQDIVWAKPNPMPESVTDRCTKSHEYIFMLAKSQKYYYDQEAIKEQGVTFENRPDGIVRDRIYDYDSKQKKLHKTDKQRGHGRRHAGFNDRWDLISKQEQCCAMRNKRSVWTVTTKPYSEAHFATFPPDLITPCILAGCPKGGTVLDPFIGSGTTAYVSKELNRKCIGIELNEKYIQLIMKRTQQEVLPL